MIYFIEDDDSIRELVIYTLNSVGFEARGFAKPSDFWNALKTETPDLILLDIMLPEEDGMEILRAGRFDTLGDKNRFVAELFRAFFVKVIVQRP